MTAVKVKRSVIDAMFADDVAFGDNVLSIVKPYKRAHHQHHHTAPPAAAAASPPPTTKQDTVSRKAVRAYMKQQLQTAEAFTAASVLPNGETCGEFLFGEWKARASKTLNI